ncbi:MAG: DUF2236 domain-containing protein [Streptosporangiales bacterium]|nr:DUF2236 domain-containing protein [Streptosporangiales bacterium]
MTASDPGAGAATEIGTMEGLIERSAAAFAAGVPGSPADDGYFGPASVTWRLSAGLAGPVSGLRALLVQALHPLAMAGVDQHSDWRADPAARYASTLKYLVVTTYGDKAAADKAARVVRKIHERVRGTDTLTGKPYAAGDPDLLLWVHAVEVDSVLATTRLFGPEATPAEEDTYVAEMTAAAELIGMPEGLAPASVAELGAYLERVRPELRVSPAAAEAAAYLVDPPDLDESVAELWGEFRDGVLGSLPGWAAELYGWEPLELSAERREEIRQALGVFDALTLGEPGVLEARQRLELRVRSARAARA